MLRITLHDGEKAIINGAVVKASGRTTLFIENKVSLLRGREVMRPEEATTPARRLYFACMLAYIDPENREQHQDSVLAQLAELLATSSDPEAHSLCIRFAHDIAHGEYYRALAQCRALIQCEEPDAAAAAASAPTPANDQAA